MQHIVVDRDGNPWGPFAKASDAGTWAHNKWPSEEQDSDHPGIKKQGKGWDVIALRQPY